MVAGCADDKIIDPIPKITFDGIEIIKNAQDTDSLLYINFNYEDEDGDLGLEDSDTSGAFRGMNNLVINFYEKNLGIYTPLLIPGTAEEAQFSQRFPSLTPTGKNKDITGAMSVLFAINALEIYADTISFDLYIIDRKLNESNLIEVSDVHLIQ